MINKLLNLFRRKKTEEELLLDELFNKVVEDLKVFHPREWKIESYGTNFVFGHTKVESYRAIK